MIMEAPTLHIKATRSEVAKTVLMPGDPLRSKFIAENFLENAKLFNNVRGVQGYTGTYKGKRISVMASGMGMPSMGIYSYELFNGFDVESIIRIGTAGALSENVKVRDIVMAMGCSTTTNFASQYHLPGTFASICDFSLLSRATKEAKRLGISYHVGNMLSADVFYDEFPSDRTDWTKMGVIAVEMEAAALYMTAARAGKKALAVCTVSDHLITGERLSTEDRERSFTEMMELALEVAED